LMNGGKLQKTQTWKISSRSMPSLPSVPIGSYVFIDANIFVYGMNGRSVQCRTFLERCASEELIGISLFEIVNEATHQFMLAEARGKGMIPPNGTPRDLNQNWRVIPTLSDYWAETERILELNLLLFPTHDELVRNAHPERNRACLLTNDSMILSCMRELEIDCLATNDGGFNRAPGITVFSPNDLIRA